MPSEKFAAALLVALIYLAAYEAFCFLRAFVATLIRHLLKKGGDSDG